MSAATNSVEGSERVLARPAENVASTSQPLGALLTLRELRLSLTSRRQWLLVTAVAVVFALVSMTVGGMISFLPTQGAYTGEVIWWGAPANWWFYPEVLLVQPWGIVQLPFLPTVATLVVAVAAGIGATVAMGPALRFWRAVVRPDRPTAVAGMASGFAPGVAAVATLGACCCTTCAAVGGLTLVAAVSGTSVGALLRTEWYLPLFQLAVVYILLVSQDRALWTARSRCVEPPTLDRRFVAGAALRLGLLVAGVTWSLAMFVEWGTVNPFSASPLVWYHWLVEHQLLSLTAIGAALFPQKLRQILGYRSHSIRWHPFRVLLATAALTWGAWVPASAVRLGLGGFLNEVLGYLGASVSAGAVVPDVPLGAALVFHWALQHLLLAGFGMGMALVPDWALRPLLWSTSAPRRWVRPSLGADGVASDRAAPMAVSVQGRPVDE